MEKPGLRRLDDIARGPLRLRGVAMIKQGMPKKDVAMALGVHVNTVTNWGKRKARCDVWYAARCPTRPSRPMGY